MAVFQSLRGGKVERTFYNSTRDNTFQSPRRGKVDRFWTLLQRKEFQSPRGGKVVDDDIIGDILANLD